MREIIKTTFANRYRFCRFDNEYGAKIRIQSYDAGKTPFWTLTVLRFDGPGWDDCYPCTGLSHELLKNTYLYFLYNSDLKTILTLIENLPNPTPLLTSIGFF